MAINKDLVWGGDETRYFYDISPDRVLQSVESFGLKCTGRVMPLNSMENRVYEVELDLDPVPKNPSDRFRIVKFYRPGRWSREQILEEHQFLKELAERELPVVPPIENSNGETLLTVAGCEVYYCLFPKIGGRSNDELTDDLLLRIGRLIARLHDVGQIHPAEHRPRLTAESYGISNLEFLLSHNLFPAELRKDFESVITQICKASAPLLSASKTQRIHGDCHLGNILWRSELPVLVDFDDMVTGPCVQDLWLLVPGRDEFSRSQLNVIVEGYEEWRPFDRASLVLIEPLRALRRIHFAAWIGRRWSDPAFPRAFPYYGTNEYWRELLLDLREQLQLITQA